MRHGKKFNHLSRQKGHRAAMLANMACSLIEHKRINTTVAKAKALKQFVEPLITKSKEDTTHNRRICFAYLRSKYAVTDLFRDVAAKVGDRPGGYTRIIKVGNRLGDNADMAMIELVDFNELYNGGKKEEKKAKSRRGGKAKGATTAPAAAPKAEAPVADAPEAKIEEAPVAEAQVEDTSASELAEQTPVAEAPAVEEAPEAETPEVTPEAEAPEAPAAEDNTEEKAE
jgi:large subunit ribosomal protein L17